MRSTSGIGCRNPRLGFSMIELIVSVVIVGILAAAATPRIINGVSRYRIDAAVARLTADLELAAIRARDTGTPETVTINASGNLYSFSAFMMPGSASPYVVNLAAAPYETTISAVKPVIGSITFDGFGFPNAELAVKLSAGPATRTVRLNSTTSRVTVEGN